MKTFLTRVVCDDLLHTKWLNTLSFLENIGAKKIAAYEHLTLVKEEILKHAAEEFRHAYYLKQQMYKLNSSPPQTYTHLLGGWSTLHYLERLECVVCRLNKAHAYPLVTYAIEKRAQSLYPLYHTVLKAHGSRVTIKSIILEEEEHLQEMEQTIAKIPNGDALKKRVCELEDELYQKWKKELCTKILDDISN